MGIYAALGVSQSLTMFFMGASFAILTYFASQKLHEVSLRSLFAERYSHNDLFREPSPVSFMPL